MSMRVRELAQEHAGRRATVLGRSGFLDWSQVPGYPRNVKAWYLITPCPLPQFEEQAVSLQWSEDAEVIFE